MSPLSPLSRMVMETSSRYISTVIHRHENIIWVSIDLLQTKRRICIGLNSDFICQAEFLDILIPVDPQPYNFQLRKLAGEMLKAILDLLSLVRVWNGVPGTILVSDNSQA